MRDRDHKDDPDLHDRWRDGPRGGGGSGGNRHDRGGDMHGRRVDDRNYNRRSGKWKLRVHCEVDGSILVHEERVMSVLHLIGLFNCDVEEIDKGCVLVHGGYNDPSMAEEIAVDLKQAIIEEERDAEKTKVKEGSQSQAEETRGAGDDMDTDSKSEVRKPTDLTVEVVDSGKEITAQEWEDLKQKEKEGDHMDNTDGPPITVNEDCMDGNKFKTPMASPITPSP